MVTTIQEIEYYPANIVVIWDSGEHSSINYDSQQGEFTRDEWRQQLKEGYGIQLDEDVEYILDALSNTSNIDFFQEEEDVEE